MLLASERQPVLKHGRNTACGGNARNGRENSLRPRFSFPSLLQRYVASDGSIAILPTSYPLARRNSRSVSRISSPRA